MDLDGRLEAAWSASRSNLGNEICFYAPSIKHFETSEYANSPRPLFVPVSVTGKGCKLNCKHCRGSLLQWMHEAKTPDDLIRVGSTLRDQGCQGLLVSGGAERDGSVPLLEFAPAMSRLKREFGFKIAVHTGLVDLALAQALADAKVDSAMIDIIGSDETIREVYNLQRTVADYAESLRLLVESGVAVSPHIIVGLHFGQVVGEHAALELTAEHEIASLVLVVISPLRSTAMASVTPPSPEAIADVLVTAREALPATPTLLGCARPGGEHKLATDEFALRAGINGVAYPADGTVAKARSLGLKPKFFEYCCSLIFDDMER